MKNVVKYLVWLFPALFLFFTLSCTQAKSVSQQELLKVAESLDALHLLQFIKLEAVYGETIVPDKDKLGFFISGEQEKIYSGRRSEISVNYPYSPGDKVGYSFEMLLPENYAGDTGKRWSIFAQWHDQPNPALGETWATFPGRSPLVFIYDEIEEGELRVGVRYGEHKEILPLRFGEWNRLDFQFLWSEGSEGKLRLKVNEHEFSFSGPNMLNAYHHYLKIGMYRHPDIRTENKIYFRNLNITSENKG